MASVNESIPPKDRRVESLNSGRVAHSHKKLKTSDLQVRRFICEALKSSFSGNRKSHGCSKSRSKSEKALFESVHCQMIQSLMNKFLKEKFGIKEHSMKSKNNSKNPGKSKSRNHELRIVGNVNLTVSAENGFMPEEASLSCAENSCDISNNEKYCFEALMTKRSEKDDLESELIRQYQCLLNYLSGGKSQTASSKHSKPKSKKKTKSRKTCENEQPTAKSKSNEKSKPSDSCDIAVADSPITRDFSPNPSLPLSDSNDFPNFQSNLTTDCVSSSSSSTVSELTHRKDIDQFSVPTSISLNRSISVQKGQDQSQHIVVSSVKESFLDSPLSVVLTESKSLGSEVTEAAKNSAGTEKHYPDSNDLSFQCKTINSTHMRSSPLLSHEKSSSHPIGDINPIQAVRSYSHCDPLSREKIKKTPVFESDDSIRGLDRSVYSTKSSKIENQNVNTTALHDNNLKSIGVQTSSLRSLNIPSDTIHDCSCQTDQFVVSNIRCYAQSEQPLTYAAIERSPPNPHSNRVYISRLDYDLTHYRTSDYELFQRGDQPSQNVHVPSALQLRVGRSPTENLDVRPNADQSHSQASTATLNNAQNHCDMGGLTYSTYHKYRRPFAFAKTDCASTSDNQNVPRQTRRGKWLITESLNCESKVSHYNATNDSSARTTADHYSLDSYLPSSKRLTKSEHSSDRGKNAFALPTPSVEKPIYSTAHEVSNYSHNQFGKRNETRSLDQKISPHVRRAIEGFDLDPKSSNHPRDRLPPHGQRNKQFGIKEISNRYFQSKMPEPSPRKSNATLPDRSLPLSAHQGVKYPDTPHPSHRNNSQYADEKLFLYKQDEPSNDSSSLALSQLKACLMDTQSFRKTLYHERFCSPSNQHYSVCPVNSKSPWSIAVLMPQCQTDEALTCAFQEQRY